MRTENVTLAEQLAAERMRRWAVEVDARHMRMILELIADTPTSRKHREAARAALTMTKNAPWVVD